VSNIDRADLDAALARHGLGGCFTHLVTSQDAHTYKPRPEMFSTALGLLGLGPREVVHVGGSLTGDVAGAARLGIPVAWVNRQGRPAPEAGPRPTYEVADLGELLALLDG
jgi:2-haloacid dehalogenase/putative hydrolase of the HAD superfamily